MKLRVNNLNYKNSEKKILESISFEINGPGLIAVLGKNGAGKSTLLRSLIGLDEENTAKIYLEKENLKEISLAKRSQLIAWCPAESQVNFSFSVADILHMGLHPWNDPQIKKQSLQKITTLLKYFSLEEKYSQEYACLSSGEKKIINLLRVLTTPHKLIILDEPSAYLDLDNICKVFHLLAKEARSGKTILIATHDIQQAYETCDQMILLQKGKIISHDKKINHMSLPKLRETFGIPFQEVQLPNSSHKTLWFSSRKVF